MTISFACPSCHATGSVDASMIGTVVCCRHCRHRFPILDPNSNEVDVYALEEPAAKASALDVGHDEGMGQEQVFTRAPGVERSGSDRPRRKQSNKADPAPLTPRRREPGFPWKAWLIRAGLATGLTLVAIMLFAPEGMWLAGCILMLLGSILVLVGFSAGAYGAFSEDMIYGLLYLLIPFYTAYYIVTRWEDLRIWFTCSTLGVGLVLAGKELVGWAGAST